MLRSARHSEIGLLAAFALFVGVRLPHADDPHSIEFADTRWGNARLTLPLVVVGVITVSWWRHTVPHDLSFYSAFQAFAAGTTAMAALHVVRRRPRMALGS